MSESTIDQQFIEYVVKSLVGKPDEVKVERTIDEKGVLLLLTVDPEDLGRVIGKRGATAQSLRTLLRALGTKNEARYNLKIVDNGVPKEDRNSDQGSGAGWASEPSAKGSDDEASSSDSSSDDVADVDEDDTSVAETDDEPNDDEESDAVARARRELEDLDDLDV